MNDHETENLLETAARLLEKLRPVPDRDPQAAANGRAAFLAQAQSLAPAVSPQPTTRHRKWNNLLHFRKEPLKMTVFTTLMLVLALVFGGTSATVYAAQGSAPDEPLYSVKIASEDWRLALANKSQTQLSLNLEFANRRIDELAAMLQEDQSNLEAVQNRWEDHLRNALQLAAQGSDEQIQNQLGQITLQLKNQEQVMNQVNAIETPEAQMLQQQIKTRIQDQMRLCADGLADPQQFRAQEQHGQTGAGLTNTPGADSPGNPWTDGTPTPGSGYGEGNGSNPWTDGTPTPGSGYGEGNGGNPWTDITPTPGSGYGPGPGLSQEGTLTCTPNASYGPGPQTNQPGDEGDPEPPDNGQPDDKGGTPGGQGSGGKGK